MSIEIVVPIYNAFDVVKSCLDSLITHNKADKVLIINDASTDERINVLINKLPSNWQIINNTKNLGFVKTANIGLKNSRSHSILLNSDTLVTDHWLDRFRQAVDEVDYLGTATPWSNNAEICSIPETLKNNTIEADLDEIAIQFNSHHTPVWPEIPTAVGFCMLVTAEAKAKVGFFDETTFGKGYGEENDYSMRITQSGLKNILVDNCYIAHVGNQSFQEVGLKPDQNSMQRLLAKHPDYAMLIEKYIKSDPLSSLRQSIIAKIHAFK